MVKIKMLLSKAVTRARQKSFKLKLCKLPKLTSLVMRRFRPRWAPSGRRWICQTRSLPGESTRGISGEDKEEKL